MIIEKIASLQSEMAHGIEGLLDECNSTKTLDANLHISNHLTNCAAARGASRMSEKCARTQLTFGFD